MKCGLWSEVLNNYFLVAVLNCQKAVDLGFWIGILIKHIDMLLLVYQHEVSWLMTGWPFCVGIMILVCWHANPGLLYLLFWNVGPHFVHFDSKYLDLWAWPTKLQTIHTSNIYNKIQKVKGRGTSFCIGVFFLVHWHVCNFVMKCWSLCVGM